MKVIILLEATVMMIGLSGRRACGALEPELLSSHALNLTKKIILPTPPHDSYQSRTEC